MSKTKRKSSREKHSKKSKRSKKRKSHKKTHKSIAENDIQASTSNSSSYKVKSHKRKRSRSSSTDSSSSSSSFESKTRNQCQKKDDKNMKKLKNNIQSNDEETDMNVPLDLMGTSKAMRPQTREEWQQKQEQIKRVLDPDTGRYRLIKGEGEILEEIVSRSQHKEINKKATAFDGQYFESHTVKK